MPSKNDIIKAFNLAKQRFTDRNDGSLATIKALCDITKELRQAGIDVDVDVTPATSELAFALQQTHCNADLPIAAQTHSGTIIIGGEDRYPFAIGHLKNMDKSQKTQTYMFLSTFTEQGMKFSTTKMPSTYYDLSQNEKDCGKLYKMIIEAAAQKSTLKEQCPDIINNDGTLKSAQLKIQTKKNAPQHKQ